MMLLLTLTAAFLVVVGLIVLRRRHLSPLMSLAGLLEAAIAMILAQDMGWTPR